MFVCASLTSSVSFLLLVSIISNQMNWICLAALNQSRVEPNKVYKTTNNKHLEGSEVSEEQAMR